MRTAACTLVADALLSEPFDMNGESSYWGGLWKKQCKANISMSTGPVQK